ncbi:MAG TPA: carboxypeptidase-like regulatory domain-containing protein, partial [Solirubrobacterales bacterium]|nr:carboxypeptidase-like regulatory domain-containing protein [Solirubrobacterales bacterium]
MLLCLVLGAAPGFASAKGPSQFVVEMCDPAISGGNAAGAVFTGNTNFVTPNNNCGQPGGSLGIYAFHEFGKDQGPENSWTLPVSAPPGGGIEALTLSASACGGNQWSEFYVMKPGWPPNCLGESRETFKFNPTLSSATVPIVLNCTGFCPAGSQVYARYIAVKEVDPVAPQVVLGGSLLSGEVARGHQGVSAEASDQGGGVSSLELLVNGQQAGIFQPHCEVAQAISPNVFGTVAASPTPCPKTVKTSWSVDTASTPFEQSTNSVQVCASDFSSVTTVNKTCSAPQTVDVNNSCAESAVAGGANLTAKFARNHDEEVTVPYNHGANVVGALMDASGNPVRGATICVQGQLLGVHRETVPIAVETTDAQGHFTYKLRPGPNRRVKVGYRHDSFQVNQLLRFQAHSKPTIHLSASLLGAGGTVHISGKIPGPNAGSRSVAIEASAPHSP